MKHTISALALLSIATTPLFAEESVVSAIPELPVTIVTGELWESELQKTTASVTVLNQAALEGKGVQHFEDVINAIPNLTWTGATSRPRYIQIRGIGENSQFEGETPDSTVRFLVDDLDFTGVGTIGNLFDVQQVEVLRGPQAGAFGANAAGGMIRIVTNDPTPYWTGQTEATIGNDNLRAVGIAVGGPLLEDDPESLTFRAVVHKLEQDGFRDNEFLNKDNTNKRNELSSRLKVRWLANEDWELNGTVLYADFDNGYDEFSLGNTEFKTFSDTPGKDDQKTKAGSLRATWSGQDDFTLTSVTSVVETDSLYSFDSDWADPTTDGNYDGFLSTERDRSVFSQEIRIDSIEQTDALGWIDRWTVGAYLNQLKEDSDVLYTEFDGVSATYKSEYEAESVALFGQIAHDFSDATRLIIGLRYEYYQIDAESDGSLYGVPAGGRSDQSDPLWGGKITLEHDINETQMLFASIARGYKGGGANIASFTAPGDPLTYDNETLWNYEVGLKSDWFDGALSSKVTAFYLYRVDPQLRDSQGAGGFFRYLTVNGDSAEHFGLEAETNWHISNEWVLNAGLGILETNRQSYDDPSGTIPSRDLANAPSYTYNARLSYKAEGGLFGNIEVVGRDDYFESNSHNEKRDAFGVVNASIGYSYENWIFTFWAKNLFDESYQKRVFFFGNRLNTSTANQFDFESDRRYEDPADPRSFGVTASYRW